ncbi:Major centromere autoantigen [Trichinella spiralis]|uniref:Major centromere autoantigen B n=2 Tax=Trichinella spiralis TaxID=6334 RepID=A0A0V1BJB2_TRISP|nr:Major centromere autoantigen B [Trichinella spiralis]
MRRTENAGVNVLIWQYFCHARSKGFSVSSPLVKEEALYFAQQLGRSDFRASASWLECFEKRHNIKLKVISGTDLPAWMKEL